MTCPVQSQRHFLFFQGNASWFFRCLAEALHARGHNVTRLNICGGDRLFWGADDWNAIDFRGRPEGFRSFVKDLFDRSRITDVIMFSDTRIFQQQLIEAATARGARAWVFEEGYLRPHWITLELGGVNGFSPMPRSAESIRRRAFELQAPSPQSAVGPGLWTRIALDFRWQIANYLMLYRYPHYRTHRPYPIFAEYASWTLRLAKLLWRRASGLIGRRKAYRAPYFLFALQLDSDSQIRIHSPFGRLPTAIYAVLEDFAAHAAADCRLIIKNHPLDNGWINYSRLIRRASRKFGIADRVQFIDGGDLYELIDHAEGVVTVNSTVGMTAIAHGVPTICLGTAIYDFEGLTFQGPLCQFWNAPTKPKLDLYCDFHKVVMNDCLVNGNFYTSAGVNLAVLNSIERLIN